MNSPERYPATLEGCPVDHLARVPILMRFAAGHIGSHYGALASDYHVLTQANPVRAREFGKHGHLRVEVRNDAFLFGDVRNGNANVADDLEVEVKDAATTVFLSAHDLVHRAREVANVARVHIRMPDGDTARIPRNCSRNPQKCGFPTARMGLNSGSRTNYTSKIRNCRSSMMYSTRCTGFPPGAACRAGA